MKSRKGIGGNLNALLWIVFIVVLPRGGWGGEGLLIRRMFTFLFIVESFRFEDENEI